MSQVWSKRKERDTQRETPQVEGRWVGIQREGFEGWGQGEAEIIILFVSFIHFFVFFVQILYHLFYFILFSRAIDH